MVDEKMFRIRLSSQNHEFEVEGSKDFVEKWYKDFKEGVSVENTSDSGENLINAAPSKEKEPSIAEIYDPEEFGKKVDRALFTGWSLEKIKGEEQFTKSEIKSTAKEYKINLGANLIRDVKHLIKRGHMEKVGEKDGENSYYLTRTGEQYIKDRVES